MNLPPGRTCVDDLVILAGMASTGRRRTATVAVILTVPGWAERVTGVLAAALPPMTEAETPLCPEGPVTLESMVAEPWLVLRLTAVLTETPAELR